MPKKTASDRQTVIDLAIQLYGSVDSVITMIQENPDLVNVDTDPTNVVVNYTLNKEFNQRFFIAKGIDCATKPETYLNTTEPALLSETNSFLLQEDGYRILM